MSLLEYLSVLIHNDMVDQLVPNLLLDILHHGNLLIGFCSCHPCQGLFWYVVFE